MPLMIVLHGAGGTARSMDQSTDYAAVGAARGDLVAFPQGYDDTWNEGAGGTPARRAGIDDVAFIAKMIAQIEARLPVNRARIAAAGMSNGALMVQYLGCRLASTIRLIEPVEGEMPVSVAARCRPSRPVSLVEIHATGDQTIPYGGGPFAGVGGGTTVLSAPASAAKWATLDHCGSSPVVHAAGGRRITRYTGCHGGSAVQLVTIEGGSHTVPADAGLLLANALR